MFTNLIIDYETRSVIDLRKHALERYAEDPSTEVLVMGYVFDDGEPEYWWPSHGSLPDLVKEHIEDGKLVTAHNASFEMAITNSVATKKYGFPPLKPEQIACTMAMAYSMALPGSLEKAAPAAGIQIAKDMEGHRLMLQMCKPRKTKNGQIEWWYDEEKLKRLTEYCLKDVLVERELYNRLLKLSQNEKKIWVLDYEINQNGIPLDVDAAKAALEVVDLVHEDLDAEIKIESNNWIGSTSSIRDLHRFLDDYCFDIDGVDKATVTSLLEQDLPSNIRRVLELRQEGAKSSTAKIQTMLNIMGDDGRMRNSMQYYGATTGRWAGRKIQPQNFVRPHIPQSEIDWCFEILHDKNLSTREKTDTLRMFHGSVLTTLSYCLRGFLKAPPGKKFIGMDWNAIEARMLSWLAGQENKLELFRSNGKIYEASAAAIYLVGIDEVTKDQRQIGKVSELALGYQGAVGAFQKMAKGYGVKVEDKFAKVIVQNWRNANPKIVQFWYDLERAAKAAVLNPGQAFQVKNPYTTITYAVKGSFLFCQLPSKRCLVYPYPKVETIEFVYEGKKLKNESVTFMGEDSKTKKWVRMNAYGGFFAENVTQASSRDILSEALMRLSREHFYKVVLHVHDEILLEVPEHYNEVHFKEVKAIMETLPSWAKGLPLTAEGFEGTRFQK